MTIAQAVLPVAFGIMAGGAESAITSGAENRGRAPYLLHGGRWGYRTGPARIMGRMPNDGLNDAFAGGHAGWHIKYPVTREQISREGQEGFAARLRKAYSAAQTAGHVRQAMTGTGSRAARAPASLIATRGRVRTPLSNPLPDPSTRQRALGAGRLWRRACARRGRHLRPRPASGWIVRAGQCPTSTGPRWRTPSRLCRGPSRKHGARPSILPIGIAPHWKRPIRTTRLLRALRGRAMTTGIVTLCHGGGQAGRVARTTLRALTRPQAMRGRERPCPAPQGPPSRAKGAGKGRQRVAHAHVHSNLPAWSTPHGSRSQAKRSKTGLPCTVFKIPSMMPAPVSWRSS
ncbi:hypothetical protein ERN12_16520 [Rhodobacteraceae bacterium]|nr:hypothetical protein ERN12_16520 [Paracoccaceae bacterium]